MKNTLELLATEILNQTGVKPNLSNRDFMNCVIIFQYAMMDKMFDNQNYDKMDLDDREKMAYNCGLEIRKLVHTFTSLDTHDIENFI